MTDPVSDRNADDERQVLELAHIDEHLDAVQQQWDELLDRDPLRALWFGLPDEDVPQA